MKSKMFIPSTLKIGFQERQGTFTGKLAYIIYYDEKGKLRKETSWEGWRHKNIPSIEISNDPVDGFVLNKGVERYSDWGNSGRSMIRVHDSRGFEFEITVDNLIGILMHSDVSKREINTQCVFAWWGTELVLLPTNSEEYKASLTFTSNQSEKLSTKDLVPGRVYKKKKTDEKFVYIGFREFWEIDRKQEYVGDRYGSWYNRSSGYYHNDVSQINKGKKHIFQRYGGGYGTTDISEEFETPSVSILLPAVADDIVSDFASRVEEFEHSIHACALKKLEFVPLTAEFDQYYGKIHKTTDTDHFTIGVQSRIEIPNYYSLLRDKKPAPDKSFNDYSKVDYPNLLSRNASEIVFSDQTNTFVICSYGEQTRMEEDSLSLEAFERQKESFRTTNYPNKYRMTDEVRDFLSQRGFMNCHYHLANGNVVKHRVDSLKLF